MSKPLKPRRGTTAEQNAFVGEAYEITYDTDKNTIVCRDGLTAGGFPLAKEGDLNAFKTSQSAKDSQQDAAIQQAVTAANTAKSGADTANAAVAGLATVARTGSYNDLSNKPSIPATPKAYITETWKSGTSWYRKYSDGWIEQGGVVSVPTNGTVTLNTAFSTTNYNVLSSWYDGYSGAPGIYSRTKSNFVVQFASSKSYSLAWVACGY